MRWLLLVEHLRFPDGSFGDALAYSVDLCHDGLFQVVSPLGERLELYKTYDQAKLAWLGEQLARPQKRWYQYLVGWVDRGFCTTVELGIVVTMRRMTKAGLLKESTDAAQVLALNTLGAVQDPLPAHLAQFAVIRQAEERGESLADILLGLRQIERCDRS